MACHAISATDRLALRFIFPTCRVLFCETTSSPFSEKNSEQTTQWRREEDDLSTNRGKEGPKHVHILNCDKTDNLDSVEELFCKVKDDIRKKLCFDIELPIRKNYAPINEKQAGKGEGGGA